MNSKLLKPKNININPKALEENKNAFDFSEMIRDFAKAMDKKIHDENLIYVGYEMIEDHENQTYKAKMKFLPKGEKTNE